MLRRVKSLIVRGASGLMDLMLVKDHLRARVVGRESIIIDHTCTDVAKIPDHWVERSRKLTVHYAHTSHGSQIISALEYLQKRVDACRYAVVIRNNADRVDLPPESHSARLRIYDGNPPKTYVEPRDYWDGAAGMNRTRAVAGTGLFNCSMWSWCGQQSWNSVRTVQRYLEALDLLEQEYPAMRFIYMTGHTDGGSRILRRNNDLVRSYCRENNKVLFDFADIESWDPEGNHYPDTTDACEWCYDWCAKHPEDGVNLPECAHTHGFSGVLKAKAFWWMMARLAGWDGVSA